MEVLTPAARSAPSERKRKLGAVAAVCLMVIPWWVGAVKIAAWAWGLVF